MPSKLSTSWSWVLIFCVANLWLLAGCTSTSQRAASSAVIPPDKSILRVGVSTNAPPLIYKQGNKIVGLEAEFAQELAKDLGKSLRFIELKWKDLIPALLENRIDIIMSGMTRTPLREVRIAFTIPYFTSGQMALIRREDSVRFRTGFFSLTTSSAIGAIKDTTGEYFVETRFSSVKKKLFSNPKSAVKDLIDKRIDIFIHDAPMILYLASENETKGLTALFALLTKEELAWGIRKDNVELLKSVNSFLQNPKNEKKLKQMIQYWIPFSK
jgi:polar amino acid transport system substrate-binding protein